MENEIRKIRDAVAKLRKHKGLRYSAELRADLIRVSSALRAEENAGLPSRLRRRRLYHSGLAVHSLAR